jgi:hypothetical protein
MDIFDKFGLSSVHPQELNFLSFRTESVTRVIVPRLILRYTCFFIKEYWL